jgi:hypothetical protein
MTLKRSSSARLLAALLATTCAVSAPAAWAQTAEITFDIPAQGLASALNEFSRQAGVQILFPYDATDGRASKALKGRYTARAALTLLLAGSPLVIDSDNGRTIGLVTARKAGQGQFSGLVRQAEGQAPLSGVLVRVDGDGQTAVTDSEGYYRFGNLSSGAHSLTFRLSRLSRPESEHVRSRHRRRSPDVTVLGEAPRFHRGRHRPARRPGQGAERAAQSPTMCATSCRPTRPGAFPISTPPNRCAACPASRCSAR